MSLTDSPFPETRWSLVQRVRAPGTDDDQAAAMEELCRLYWRPVYLYARRDQRSREDAEDITQAFFASLIERGSITGADRTQGRLRTFLLTLFQRFSVSQWRHQTREKRGGRIHFTGIEQAENSLLAATPATACAAYDQAWAIALVEETEAMLERDYTARGRGQIYRHLRPLLAWDTAPDGTADTIAAACGLTNGAVRIALKRLREAWRRTLEKNVALTVTAEAEIEDEVRHVIVTWAQK